MTTKPKKALSHSYAVEALQKANIHALTILERMKDGFVALDKEWRFVYVNPQAEQMLGGKTREELLEKPLWEVFPQAKDSIFEQKCREALETQEKVGFEAFYEPRERWFELDVYPSGEDLTLYFRDITQRKKAEQAFREHEEFVRKLLQNFPNGSVNVFDKDLRYLFAEGKGLEQVGLSSEQLVGKTLAELFSQEDVDYVTPYYHKAFEGEAVTFELWVAGQCYSINAAPLQDNNGTIYAIIAVALNITERKRVEQALLESDRRLQLALETAKLGLWQLDLATGFLDCSAICKANFGLPPETRFTYEALNEMILAEDRNQMRQAVERALEGHTVYEAEYRVRWTDGTVHWIIASGRGIYGDDGKPLSMVGVTLEVTERKQMEQHLRASEERFRLLLQSTDQGIFGIDRDEACTFINRSGARMLGYEPEEIIGENMHRLVHHSHRNGTPYPEETCAILQTFQRKQGIRIDSEVFWRKDRSCFPVEYSSYPILEEDGLRGAVVTFLDITERKEFERRKDEFLSMASHELKTPLSNMWILTHLLRKQLAEQGFQDSDRNLSLLGTQARQLMKLLTDVLEVSQLEAGYLLYAEEPFDVNTLVHEIVSTLQQVSTDHTIVITGRADRLVIGDRDRLGQVLTNLLTNAIKYSVGTDKIDVLIASTDEVLTIRVRDYGVGIPHEQQLRIFERFYRVQNRGQGTSPGFGMGLYISREIVKRHGGQITVESEEGKGSIFSVVLPLKK